MIRTAVRLGVIVAMSAVLVWWVRDRGDYVHVMVVLAEGFDGFDARGVAATNRVAPDLAALRSAATERGYRARDFEGRARVASNQAHSWLLGEAHQRPPNLVVLEVPATQNDFEAAMHEWIRRLEQNGYWAETLLAISGTTAGSPIWIRFPGDRRAGETLAEPIDLGESLRTYVNAPLTFEIAQARSKKTSTTR